MQHWKIAAVQMDCRLGNKQENLAAILSRIDTAAKDGARLAIFPECALTGYCFESKAEAAAHAEPIPGPSSAVLEEACKKLNVWCVVGLLERDESGRLFNACVLLGPQARPAGYRKVHLPCLGVDRFTTPGDRPFAVHDLGGLRIGLTICYDGSFPEASRVLALLGADLIVLPTNWPPEARATAEMLPRARALENHVYYAAVNRVGRERGFQFIGLSQILDYHGRPLATAGEEETILYADIEPQKARAKRIVNIPGQYEVDRVGDRRPEMYGPICQPAKPALQE